MDRVNRARVLLEQALARQKGVPLEDFPPIPVNYREVNGLENYAGNYSYRRINNALRANDASKWDEVIDKRLAGATSKSSTPEQLNSLRGRLQEEYERDVIRAAIALEDELKLNPSPYSEEILGQPFNQQGYDNIELLVPSKDKQLYRLNPPERRTPHWNDLDKQTVIATPKLTYRDNPLYRGMHFTEEGKRSFLDSLEKDGVNKAYTSFSLDLNEAKRFLRRFLNEPRAEEYGVFMKVSPNADQAIDTAHPYWAFNPREQEFIYLPGTRFEVQDIKELDDKVTEVSVMPKYTDLSIYSQKMEKYKEDLALMEKARLLERQLTKMQVDMVRDNPQFGQWMKELNNIPPF